MRTTRTETESLTQRARWTRREGRNVQRRTPNRPEGWPQEGRDHKKERQKFLTGTSDLTGGRGENGGGGLATRGHSAAEPQPKRMEDRGGKNSGGFFYTKETKDTKGG